MVDYPPHNFFFFFNDTATTEIYTLSLHDALPISHADAHPHNPSYSDRHSAAGEQPAPAGPHRPGGRERSEEHTSELQSPCNLVCRLLLEKKKQLIVPTLDAPSILGVFLEQPSILI